MHIELNFRNRIIIIGIVTLMIWTLLLWDYFHGGVPTHHIMQREDLPGISNWWGGLVIPLITWGILYRIIIRKRETSASNKNPNKTSVFYRFISGLIFGIGISFFFTIDSNITGYMMLSLFIIALFLPLYLGEYLLGFIIGTVYTLGGIIPVVFGSMLMGVFWLLYKFSGLILSYARLKK